MRVHLLFLLVFKSLAAASPQPQMTDIHIAFGYKDARPARLVGDRYERLYILQKLTTNCSASSSNQACGFERDLSDANLLTRKVKNQVFRIRITASSAGADDLDNRKNAYQKYLTQISENNFIYGLRTTPVVFYVGHSRDGGGPDFSPPRLLVKNNHVDYNYYRKHQPGFKKLLESLSQKQKAQDLSLGLFSCDSTKHFEEKIRRHSTSVKILTTTNLVYYTDALARTLQELSVFLHKESNSETSD